MALKLCHCGLDMLSRAVATAVPGGQTVIVSLCPECDHRVCPRCKTYVPSLTSTKCPHGHTLDLVRQ